MSDKIKYALLKMREQEDELNLQIGNIDKQIRFLTQKKESIAKKVSKNMRKRNSLINKL